MNEAHTAEPRAGSSSPSRDEIKTLPRWVPETCFGRWFIGTKMWERRVVDDSMRRFVRLLAGRGRSPRRVLDAGCGPGSEIPLIEQYFKPDAIVAVDVDPGEVERARVQSRRCRCEVDVSRADVTRLAYPDRSFDMVVCHQTLHHVVDQEAVLREFHRVLAPGGVLLISESCRAFILSTLVRALFRHPNEVQKSAAEYQQLLRAAGFSFTATEVEATRPYWSLADWGLLARLGRPPKHDAEPTQVAVAAFKPT